MVVWVSGLRFDTAFPGFSGLGFWVMVLGIVGDWYGLWLTWVSDGFGGFLGFCWFASCFG